MGDPSRIPVRELRNHVSEVLRRVEAGETLEVTVNDRPVALLVPRHERPETLPFEQFVREIRMADPGLRDELRAELPESTDDLDDPWAR